MWVAAARSASQAARPALPTGTLRCRLPHRCHPSFTKCRHFASASNFKTQPSHEEHSTLLVASSPRLGGVPAAVGVPVAGRRVADRYAERRRLWTSAARRSDAPREAFDDAEQRRST
eukprot:Selendium_serpulae@DN6040_c0_g2_i1.p1